MPAFISQRGPSPRRTYVSFELTLLTLLTSWPLTAQAQSTAATHSISFRNDIMPLLSRAGCNMGTCHGNQNGKGGFRLSLRGDDPAFDILSLTHDQLARRVDPLAPAQSLLLQKATGLLPHEGGVRFARNSIEAQRLLFWIASGAKDDNTTALRVQSLSVHPSSRILPPGQMTEQIIAIARFSDGTLRDVTGQATFEVADPIRASISPTALVHAKRPTEAIISVRYATSRASSRLTFIAHNPQFTWTGSVPTHPIDVHVFTKLRDLQINPSPLSPDSTFLRRAHLDAIGRLPTAADSRAFLADPDPAKRVRLIDRLLARPEFADYWALKWADLLRVEEKTMGEKGSWIFHRWLRDQIALDRPLDQLVRSLVSSLGSTWQNPPSAFHRGNRDPNTAAETVAQVFLGIRLQCARCHNHPFDSWTQADYFSLAAFFAGLERKQVKHVVKDKFDSHQINGDEVVYAARPAKLAHPRNGHSLPPRFPGAQESISANDPHILDRLADQLTSNNPQFRKNLANRVWFHLMGRGIVDPVDDFRESNPASNPILLDEISTYLEANDFRLRPLVAWIMKSRTYQLSATPQPTNIDDDANFSHAAVHLLSAEILLDAMSDALGVPERFKNTPKSTRAAQLPGVAGNVSFLKDFGQPDRLLTCECERSDSTTLAQAFQVINGATVRRKLELSTNRLGCRLSENMSDPAILDELYLASLCRPPTRAERTAILSHLASAPNRRQAWEDTAWAILGSKEFQLRH